MIQLVKALQDYCTLETVIKYWCNMVNDFICNQEYSLEDYREFCEEAQNLLPINPETSRQLFLTDLTVKPVPFAEGVWYAMCTYPNFMLISSNSYIKLPPVDSVMMLRNTRDYEMPAVAFFNSMDDIRAYYRDILRLGDIAFYAMSCFFLSFKELSDINVRKFKKISQRTRTHNQLTDFYSNFAISNWLGVCILGMEEEKEEDLPNANMSKIMKDCLEHFKASKDFIGRCC